MKLLQLFAFIILFSNAATAQNYLPFPDSAAVWANVIFSSSSGFNSGAFYCANGEDTTINSITYSQMDDCITGDYQGAFRDSLGKVYYVPGDSLSELLIYDFTALVGDTVNYYHTDFGFGVGSNEGVVDYTDTWMINGVNRRVVGIDASRWIEGIGCDRGFLVSHLDNVSNASPLLYCMSVNDTIRYGYSAAGNGTFVSCDFFIGLNELEQVEIDVFPNPTADQINFSIDGMVDAVVATDINGKSFFMDFTKSGPSYSTRVDGLEPGMFVLLIRSEESVYKTKIVVQ